MHGIIGLAAKKEYKMAKKFTIIWDQKPDELNRYRSIDDLPFPDALKKIVLEWFAWKLYHLLEYGSGAPDWHCKSYDPMVIEGNTAHSYVFDLEDGGRHHPFKNYKHLEKMLMDEGVERIQAMIKYGG